MRATAWLLAALALPACQAKVKTLPPTEVLLRVDASPEVRATAARVRIRVGVEATQGGAWQPRAPLTLPAAGGKTLSWPLDIPVVPKDYRNPPKLFQVVAEALDGTDQVLVQQRAITSFVKEAQLVLGVFLARCGDQPLGMICEDDASCNGERCKTCVSGACDRTPVTKSDGLPKVTGAPSTRHADSGAAGAMNVGAADASAGDAGAAFDAGEGLLAVADLGTACGHELDRACAGRNSTQKLVCAGTPGVWTVNGSCDGDNRCDPRLGLTQGMCLAVAAQCTGKRPGDAVCVGTARETCDADLLRYEANDCPTNQHCNPFLLPDETIDARCLCDSGFTDDGAGGCTNIDDCLGKDCGPGGTCVDGVNDYSCVCGSGYFGTRTKNCTNINDCIGHTCSPGGTCVDALNDYACNCAAGYTGTGTKLCTDIDECAGNASICGKGGTCSNVGGGYTCNCPAGYLSTGSPSPTCVDECSAPNVCTADYPCEQEIPAHYFCRGLLPEWTNIGAIGPYAKDGTVVTDQKTGLHWQQVVDTSSYTWDGAAGYCASLGIAGGGWRLPTKTELESIVNDGVYNPAVDSAGFPSTPPDHFWTSTPVQGYSGFAWSVYFYDGVSESRRADQAQRVRCVR